MHVTLRLTPGGHFHQLEAYRRYYASFVLSYAGVPEDEERLWTAFASTPRERFAGPGPWRVFTPAGYLDSPSDDPALLYQDITVALQAGSEINNGRPTVHAACLNALQVREGEAALHVGAGTGYYTALLAQLVGPGGSVAAFEVEPELAKRAARNLREFSQVTVHNRSGARAPMPACDIIYVNAGATDALAVWLDALRIGGRLLFPLTPAEGLGGMLLVSRVSELTWAARFIYRVTFVPCTDARDEEVARRLTADFARGDMDGVRSLHRVGEPDESAWCFGRGWWLSRRAPGS